MPQALFHAGAPERWLAESGLRMYSLHAQNSPQTHGGGRGSAVWICRFWARGSQIGEASSSLELSMASEVWFLTKTTQPSCSKGTAVFSGGGPTAQGTRGGRMDQVSALGETELRGRKQQQRSSSRKPPRGCAPSEIRPLQLGKATQKATWFFPFQHWLVYSGR